VVLKSVCSRSAAPQILVPHNISMVYAGVRTETFGSCSSVASDASPIDCDVVFGKQFMTFLSIMVFLSSASNSPSRVASLHGLLDPEDAL
jgi:hypothetical protein